MARKARKARKASAEPGRTIAFPMPETSTVLLARWLGQLHYNHIRRIESIHETAIRTDTNKPLRGAKIAEDLCLTRKRELFRVVPMGEDIEAHPISVEDVAASYRLRDLQMEYRLLQDAWRAMMRRRA